MQKAQMASNSPATGLMSLSSEILAIIVSKLDTTITSVRSIRPEELITPESDTSDEDSRAGDSKQYLGRDKGDDVSMAPNIGDTKYAAEMEDEDNPGLSAVKSDAKSDKTQDNADSDAGCWGTGTQTSTGVSTERNKYQNESVPQIAFPSTDLLSLSVTCHALRSHVAPVLFKTVVMRLTKKSSESVAALMSSSLSKHVKKLYFITQSRTDPDTSSETFGHPLFISKEQVEETYRVWGSVLVHLSRFQNLQTLVLGFYFNFSRMDDGMDSFTYSEGYAEGGDEPDTFHEDEDERIEDHDEEVSYPSWRYVMAKTLMAITADSGPTLEHIELLALPPAKLKAYRERQWVELLGRMKSFSLEMLDLDNGACWALPCYPGVLSFTLRMNEYFFNSLRSANEIHIGGARCLYLGVEEDNNHPSALAIDKTVFRSLRSVTFHHIVVGSDFISFLYNNLAHLSRVSLVDSFCGMVWPGAKSYTSWTDALRVILGINPTELEFFAVTYREFRGRYDDPLYSDKELAQWLGSMEQPLGYCSQDDKYGCIDAIDQDFSISDDWDEKGHHSQAEADWNAWQKVQAICERNRARLH